MSFFYNKISIHFSLKSCYISYVKKFFTILIILLFSSNLFAEFRMERVICTTKKTSNCGAYIYNSKTGEVYFCSSEECNVVDTPIEIFIEEEEIDDTMSFNSISDILGPNPKSLSLDLSFEGIIDLIKSSKVA